MRRLTHSLLPVLLALAFASPAGAHIISVVESSPGTAPSDMLVVDVMLDTEDVAIYGFALYVDFDPAVLSPDAVNSHQNPLTGEVYTSFYLYPDSWYISSSTLAAGGMGPFADVSIATLVFHVIQPVVNTYITPNFDYGPWGTYVEYSDSLPIIVTGQVVLNALHIPEPTTTLLMTLGFFGILCASRRRRRAA